MYQGSEAPIETMYYENHVTCDVCSVESQRKYRGEEKIWEKLTKKTDEGACTEALFLFCFCVYSLVPFYARRPHAQYGVPVPARPHKPVPPAIRGSAASALRPLLHNCTMEGLFLQ